MAKPAKIPKEQVISPRGDPSLDVAPETEKWASTAPRVDSVTGRGVTNLVHGGTGNVHDGFIFYLRPILIEENFMRH